jgi:hypothetical protein
VQFIESPDIVGRELVPRIGFTEGDGANWLGLVMFVGICVYLYLDSLRANRDEGSGPSLG